jgi:hypothetical protein
MALPTALDVYAQLEGYGIDNTVISESWIENERDMSILPYLESIIRYSFSAVEEYTEYLSGNNTNLLLLSKRPVVELLELRYISVDQTVSNLINSVEVDEKRGQLIIKGSIIEGRPVRNFLKGKKNIKVTYTAGLNDFVDANGNEKKDLKKAIVYMMSSITLTQIGARTGGGSISQQAWARTFGPVGKFSDYISFLNGQAYSIIRRYATGVVGT